MNLLGRIDDSLRYVCSVYARDEDRETILWQTFPECSDLVRYIQTPRAKEDSFIKLCVRVLHRTFRIAFFYACIGRKKVGYQCSGDSGSEHALSSEIHMVRANDSRVLVKDCTQSGFIEHYRPATNLERKRIEECHKFPVFIVRFVRFGIKEISRKYSNDLARHEREVSILENNLYPVSIQDR